MKATIPALVSALALALGACASVPKQPGYEVEPLLDDPRLGEKNPSDIVVLPVENQTEDPAVPVEDLRRYFYEGLVGRHYSPLALDYVDRQVVEASYSPGALDEEAVLQVQITDWDESRWKTRHVLRIGADVWLLDADPAAAEPELWGGHLEKSLGVDASRPSQSSTARLKDLAVRRFVEEVLQALPRRDAREAVQSGG